MTAVHGGSIPFVAGVLLPSEVQDMYPIVANGIGHGTKDAALRAYARMEYPHEDTLWVLSQVRRASRRRPARTSLRRRVLARLRDAAGRGTGGVAEKELPVRG